MHANSVNSDFTLTCRRDRHVKVTINYYTAYSRQSMMYALSAVTARLAKDVSLQKDRTTNRKKKQNLAQLQQHQCSILACPQ